MHFLGKHIELIHGNDVFPEVQSRQKFFVMIFTADTPLTKENVFDFVFAHHRLGVASGKP